MKQKTIAEGAEYITRKTGTNFNIRITPKSLRERSGPFIEYDSMNWSLWIPRIYIEAFGIWAFNQGIKEGKKGGRQIPVRWVTVKEITKYMNQLKEAGTNQKP